MSSRAGEISSIIKEQIKQYESRVEMKENGTVITVGDGIATVYGLRACMANELLRFEDGSFGVAQNLEEETVSVAILSDRDNIHEGSAVYRSGEALSVPVGEGLLGRVVNALGEPIDGKGSVSTTETRPVESPAPGIIERKGVSVPLQTGKTTIAVDTIMNQRETGVICIYVAIGQKRTSVVQIAQELSRAGAMPYTIIVSASAAESAPLQYIAPYSGCAMAEYFRAKGRDVLIIYDDLSKHAVAYRALSLLIRRPPGREAFPGDVFYLHSRLLERAACVAPEYGGGSITALPIIETQAGDVSAYIPTNVISITDGQIFLETELFHSGIRPAINPGISVSRVGGAAQIKGMKKVAGELKLLYAQYRELQAFAQFGSDLDSDTKARLALGERIVEVLKQKRSWPVRVGCQVAIVYAVTRGYLNEVAPADVASWETSFFRHLEDRYTPLLERIEQGCWEESDVSTLEGALKGFRR